MKDHEKLIILGKLEGHISYLSRRTYVKSLQLDFEDLVQEGRTKVLTVISEAKELSIRELISVCITSLNNFYAALVRKSRYGKHSGILVDLDEAFNLSDKQKLEDIFLDLQIGQLYELFDDDETKVFECLMDPPIELVRMAQEGHNKRWSTAEVKITRDILADFLGYTKKELRLVIEGMRSKAIPVFELLR